MIYIDAHTHFGKGDPMGISPKEAHKCVEMMQGIGMEGMITSPPYASIGSERNFDMANDLIGDAMKKWPDRFFGLARINPHFRETAIEKAEAYLRSGFWGIKFHPRNEAYRINDRKLVFPIMEKIEEIGGLALFHTGGQIHSHPTLIGDVADNFPEVPIMLAHYGGKYTDDAILIAKWFDNVIVDTSFCQNPHVIEKGVELAGVKQLVYASDYPQGSIELDTMKIKLADISNKDKELILGKNIRKILDRIEKRGR